MKNTAALTAARAYKAESVEREVSQEKRLSFTLSF